MQWLFDADLPIGEVLHRYQSAIFTHAAHELARDVSLVKAIVSRVDRLLARLPRPHRLLLGFHQFAPGCGEILLHEYLAGLWSLAHTAQVSEHDSRRIFPLLDPLLVALDGIRELCFDRVAIRHLDGGCQYLRQRQLAVLGEHRQQSSDGTRRDRCERPILGRKFVAFVPKEFLGSTGRRDTERIYTDDFAGVRIVDESLRFPAARERIPHCASRGKHRGGRINRIASLCKDLSAGSCREWLTSNRQPMSGVKWRLFGGACARIGVLSGVARPSHSLPPERGSQG